MTSELKFSKNSFLTVSTAVTVHKLFRAGLKSITFCL